MYVTPLSEGPRGGALTVERLDRRGEGVAGGVRVARALPGEVVVGEVSAGAMPDGRTAAPRIASPRILEPSAERVRARCPHYGACGGCSLMHASDPFVAAWKVERVRRALAARGLDAAVAGLATSPPMSRRRAVLSGRRLKRGAVVGFHARASDAVTAIPLCRLLLPSLVAVLPACEAIVAAGASRRGEMSLTLTDAPEGVDVAVTGGRALDAALREGLGGIARAGGEPSRPGIARLCWDGEVVAQSAAPAQRFGAARVVPPPGAFLQATREGEAALLAVVRAGLAGAGRVADLFSGCGTFALPLARAAEVHAVEADAAMLGALAAGWRGSACLRRVTTEARDLSRRPLSGEELAGFDAAVMDPPRAGAPAQAAALAAHGPPRVAFVSCDPASFARDAAVLVAGGYAMGPVHVVDQFRWSAHVEVAAILTRERPPRRGARGEA